MSNPRCQLPGCTRPSHFLIGQHYCSAEHKFTHLAEQQIADYLEDGKRIGGSKDTQLLAHTIGRYIRNGSYRIEADQLPVA